MRKARLTGEGRSFYHCMSRVVDKRFIFDDAEKRYFHRTMRKLEAFLGVRVITYCLMSNHFHVLLEVPDPEMMTELTVEQLLELLPTLYSKNAVLDVTQELDRAKDSPQWTREILARYEIRRGRLDCFMKELKQRFTQWYNRENGRRGTLWEDRYKSVLVEGNENALITMAAYIDLNPVRAKMVADPKDYRWSGYGEAMGGGILARNGLGRLLEEVLHGEFFQAHWKRTGNRYRMVLYDHGEEREANEYTGRGAKAGFSREKVEAVLEKRGQLSRAEILRCRVRYFCDGAVFGTVGFVDSVFKANRDRYGPNRKSGARKMMGADWGDLRVLRDLKRGVIVPSFE